MSRCKDRRKDRPTARVIGRRRPGRPVPAAVTAATAELAAAGWSVTSRIVRTKRQLRNESRRARKRGVDMVVVVGGDGAMSQAATELAGSPVTLGIIPMGTGNLLAGNLGVPTETSAAIRTLLEGTARAIDVGMVECGGKRRAFTIACGAGFDAAVMNATSRSQKVRWGKLAYLAHAIGEADQLKDRTFHLDIDGAAVEFEATQVFIANFGEMLPLAAPNPPIDADDGRLDLVAVSADGPLPALRAFWEAARQDGLGLSSGGHVFRAQAQEITVRADPPRPVEIDGSVIGMTPAAIVILPKGLRVQVPAR